MGLEARFSVEGKGDELLFTIIEDRNEQLYLYAETQNVDLRYALTNDNGLLKLNGNNPFIENIDIVNERLVGLSVDWIETRSQGVDNDSGTNNDHKPGYGPDDIFVENKPFSLRQIIDLIENDDIELTPDFQRNFIWDRTRQSKLIESILLGLPLPSIYLSQYEDGRLTVVDGLQRLSTLKAFINNDLKLTNLEYLKNCNGRIYSELDQVLSPLRLRKFAQTQIMCFVIDYRSPSRLKYDLFKRLNTGGKPLNNQEIRNCLSRPDVQSVLKEMVNLESFRRATNNSVKDTRMDAREAALRFIYFSEQYSPSAPLGRYNGDMEGILDDFTDDLNERSTESIRKFISLYNRGLLNACQLFGNQCFRKVLPGRLHERRSTVNKLLMLTFTILLSNYEVEQVRTFEDDLVFNLAQFIESNQVVFQAITWSTNSKWNIETSFREFNRFLITNLGNAI